MLFLWVIVGVLSASISRVRGADPGSSVEVVGGQDVDKNEYPWQILLRYNGEFFCGGSIINNRTVLTAAHSVEEDPKQRFGQFTVVAGEHDTSACSVNECTEQELMVSSIRMHKRYDDYELYNDIALLILDGSLSFTTSVQPVPALADKKFDKQKVINNNNCSVSGWGVFNDEKVLHAKNREARTAQSNTPNVPDTGDIQNVMQELTSTDVVSNADCNTALINTGLFVTSKMICSIDKKAGFCNGDSGGPMGCYDENGVFTQVGIVSWGPSKRCAKGKQVYTRVSNYVKS